MDGAISVADAKLGIIGAGLGGRLDSQMQLWHIIDKNRRFPIGKALRRALGVEIGKGSDMRCPFQLVCR